MTQCRNSKMIPQLTMIKIDEKLNLIVNGIWGVFIGGPYQGSSMTLRSLTGDIQSVNVIL